MFLFLGGVLKFAIGCMKKKMSKYEKKQTTIKRAMFFNAHNDDVDAHESPTLPRRLMIFRMTQPVPHEASWSSPG